MEANVGVKFELENFFPKDKHVLYFSCGIFTRQNINMEKLIPNRAQLFLRNKYAGFTMGGIHPYAFPTILGDKHCPLLPIH